MKLTSTEVSTLLQALPDWRHETGRGGLIAREFKFHDFAQAFGFMAQIIAQKYTSQERVGILFCLEPVFAASLGVLCLGEHFGLGSLIGASLVLAGVIISSRTSEPEAEAHIE